MREILRSNNPVLLSFVEVLLRDAGVQPLVADRNMSVLEGSIGALPSRVLVRVEDFTRACRILQDAGLGHWVDNEPT
jgi:hypothetical protein